MQGPKTNRLIVYLIKPGYKNPEEIVDSSQEGIDLGEVGTFYFEDSGIAAPGWVKGFFGEVLDASIALRTATARGVLLSSIVHNGKTVRFALSFGFGRYLLRPGVTEERFGLKVVLNSVHPGSLRSIDKTTLGSTPRHTREQIGKDSIASDFGIDVEQDLVSSVTGKSRLPQLGKTITGKDSLGSTVKVDISNIRTFLATSYERYLSTEYKTDFDWIDQIADVRDPQRVGELNELLISKLQKRDLAPIWMAVPEVVDWVNIKGFRYQSRKQGGLFDDLDIKDYLEAIEGKPLDLDLLKRSSIYRVSSLTDEVEATWSAYQCIYAELNHGGQFYVLNNGKWYEIINEFAKRINQSFLAMQHSDVVLIDYAHADEKEYNAAATSALPSSCCMDRKTIPHGGGHSSIEFCDIYDTKSKRMIHVKHYGGSTHLSYLFSQGAVAGELFVADREFRRKLNAKLPKKYKLKKPDERPHADKYEIVFGIISNSAKPLDIPFFSKVSLKNAVRRLEGYGYKKVSLKKIQAG